MSKIEKLIEALEANPKSDWTIHDLKRIATQFNIDYRQPGTSHVTFRTSKGNKLNTSKNPSKQAVILNL